MRPSVDTRHQRILGLVRGRSSLRLAELAAELGVSAVTVRRDVEALVADGLLDRAHGRVAWPPEPGTPPHKAKASQVIGMVVPAAEYYYADVVRGARAAAAQAGARLVLGISDYSAEGDEAQLTALLEAGATGLLLTPSWTSGLPLPAQEQRLLGLGAPVVLVERVAEPGTPLAALDRVCSDHVHGASTAVRHLAALGRRRIALLARPGTPTARPIRAGYRAALADLGLTAADVPAAQQAGTRSAGSFEAQVELLPRAVRQGSVDAALVHTDTDAVMLLRRLQACGIRVPEDLALIAYDDEIAALADVPLTAVAPPKRALGAAAVALLLERLSPESDPADPRRHFDLLPRLQVRASCGGGPR